MIVGIVQTATSRKSSNRGIGIYAKRLFESLQKLQDKSFSIKLIADNDYDACDLLHYPNFDFYFHTLPVFQKKRFVVTVHDTVPLIYKDKYPPGIKGSINFLLQKAALSKAAGIITDSETSKKDIVRFLSIPQSRITPIYLGPTVQKIRHKEYNISEKYKLPKSYFLYVGDINWNKNLNFLCEVCVASHNHLVIVGGAPVSTLFDHTNVENLPLLEFQKKYLNNKYIHAVGFVENNELSSFYAGSIALCQPSYYEGFGLPVLDSMFLGVPAIVSKNQVFKELYDEHALFFELNNTSDLIDKMNEIKSNRDIRLKLINDGLLFSKNFSWEKAARHTLEFYKKCMLKI